jgi:hypothetical protein
MFAVQQTHVDDVLASECFDWLRYALNCYVVWTSSDCETILRKLKRVPGLEEANAFVCAIDMNDGFGSFPQWAWDWFRRDRGQGPVKLWEPLPIEKWKT